MQYTSVDIDQWQGAIQDLKVLVIGDIMLDSYIKGSVQRISPEAPVPVLLYEDTIHRLGGAANVALNCSTMGAQVTIAGIVGQDEEAYTIIDLLKSHNIHTELVLQDTDRPTTTKSRVLSKNQQLLRIDKEATHDLSVAMEHHFIDVLLRHIQISKPDIVIFEDYDKGALTSHIIRKALEHCHHLGCVVTVDPKRQHFFSYQNVDIFKPNLHEVRTALNPTLRFSSLKEELQVYAQALKEQINPRNILITLSEEGAYYTDFNKEDIIPAKKRNISDVSGAGDTVIAVASIIYCLTKDMAMTTLCSNMAGGMVCEYPGVVPINLDNLILEIKKHFNYNLI